MKRFKHGLSMVEIAVAVLIIGLAVGPLIGVLSSSNKMSNASIYEEMAVHYARELADQLLRLSPSLDDVVTDAQSLTGDSSITLASLINDSVLADRLNQYNTAAEAVPMQINGNELPLRLVISPLDKAFTHRKITATQLDTSSNGILKTDRFWKISIELAWIDKNSGRNEPREIIMSIMLKEG